MQDVNIYVRCIDMCRYATEEVIFNIRRFKYKYKKYQKIWW